MTADAASLITQLESGDFNLRAQALAGLVRLGREASVALRPLLESPDSLLRSLAAQALAEIGNPDDAEGFVRALRDPVPEVRGRGAQGLARLGDARGLDALIATMNALPDILHHPATLATHLLTGYGVAALPRVMPLLKADDLMTRQRAWLVVYGIVNRLPKAGDWNALWRTLGSYQPDGAEAARNAAADCWQAWLTRPGA